MTEDRGRRARHPSEISFSKFHGAGRTGGVKKSGKNRGEAGENNRRFSGRGPA